MYLLQKNVYNYYSIFDSSHLYAQVFRVLVKITKGIEGAKVENHKFCVSVHYRNVDEKVWIQDFTLMEDMIVRIFARPHNYGLLGKCSLRVGNSWDNLLLTS